MKAIIRCNNCMTEFYDEDDLERIKQDDGIVINGCPICKTDSYLMDLDDYPEDEDWL